ncbi:MAG: thioredoxin-disulfide reductase [Epsilonproteobacteria bacterium]|nr:thioredoxin-disulfide reductase [Campylobacterota bacterium]
MKYNLVIIGSGPAGLTAGLYAARAKYDTLIIDGNQPGGALTTTTSVENWPGDESILGPDLMERIRKHAEKYGVKFAQGQVTKVDFDSYPFKLTIDNKTEVEAESVIISTGSSNKLLGCPGEKEYWAKGVATCATCDAPFYQDREVVIVGGGDTAVTEAEHLTKFAKKITIIHILDELTAKDPIKYKVLDHPKVEFIYSSTVTEIKGDGQRVTGVVVQDQKTKETKEVPTDGVFIAIGFNPNTGPFKEFIELDDWGYIKLTGETQTSKEGVFAAGDVADAKYRQAITSAGTGCMAALDAISFLGKKEAETKKT